MKFFGWLIAVPVGLIIIAFAIANRGKVELRFDPLPYELDIPIWAITIGALAVGFVLGAVIRWLLDHKWRAMANQGRRRIRALEREVASLRSRLEDERGRGGVLEIDASSAHRPRERLMPPKDAA